MIGKPWANSWNRWWQLLLVRDGESSLFQSISIQPLNPEKNFSDPFCKNPEWESGIERHSHSLSDNLSGNIFFFSDFQQYIKLKWAFLVEIKHFCSCSLVFTLAFYFFREQFVVVLFSIPANVLPPGFQNVSFGFIPPWLKHRKQFKAPYRYS